MFCLSNKTASYKTKNTKWKISVIMQKEIIVVTALLISFQILEVIGHFQILPLINHFDFFKPADF